MEQDRSKDTWTMLGRSLCSRGVNEGHTDGAGGQNDKEQADTQTNVIVSAGGFAIRLRGLTLIATCAVPG